MKAYALAFSRIAAVLLAAVAAAGATADDATLTSPAVEAAQRTAIHDERVDPAGCRAARPSCGSAEAASDCAAGKCCGPKCCQCRCVVYCEPDDYVCCRKTEKETIEKECFTVECEAVCIPKFRLPWECCSQGKCGRIRCVNVLGTEKYECEECVTTWEARRVRCSCGRCGSSGRGGCGTQAEAEAVAPPRTSEVQTASASVPIAASNGAGSKAPEQTKPQSAWSKLLWWRK